MSEPEPPIELIRRGFYTDAYFENSRRLLLERVERPRVLMQVFQKEHAWLGGIGEALAIIGQATGYFDDDGHWVDRRGEIEVRALAEGSEIKPWETVMTIEGDYAYFAHLETIYLGILARATLIERNAREAVEAANGKEVLYFGARHDHYLNQPTDGLATHRGGAAGVSTDANASRFGERGLGTVPHALIAVHGGDTVAAARAYAERYGHEMDITVLVDFDNDSVGTALEVASALGDGLWGVRLDTSGTLIDRALEDAPGYEEERRGVTPELARRVRSALDDAGHSHVRIVVSGGFDLDKVRRFEAENAPVDVYGIGSSLLRGSNDFTADVVRVDGEAVAKVGRKERPNERLTIVE